MDFALILDTKETPSRSEELEPNIVALTGAPRGHVFVRLVFQAKRYTGSRANISEEHSERGYQFNRLWQVARASSYIFFENGKERIENPALIAAC